MARGEVCVSNKSFDTHYLSLTFKHLTFPLRLTDHTSNSHFCVTLRALTFVNVNNANNNGVW